MLMPFWHNEVDPDRPAVYWNGEQRFTYRELISRVESVTARLPVRGHGCSLCLLSNHPEALVWLIALLSSKLSVLLVNPDLPDEALESLRTAYVPELQIRMEGDEVVDTRIAGYGDRIAPSQPASKLLLSTSGSTGSPKYVRLGQDALLANAGAIASALSIGPDDVAASHLAWHYSYGFSVLSSHLVRGAAISMGKGGFTDRSFWGWMRESGVTHLPAVPIQFDMLARLDLYRVLPATVRSLSQAGGPLPAIRRREAAQVMTARGGRFYVMYGQTEAAPRMTTLAPEQFDRHEDSVGQALTGGRLEILDDRDEPLPAGQVGRVVYHGPNVMLGYALSRSDLALGDECGGRLETGDLGWLDEHGFLTLTGRQARSIKVFGLRVDLDRLESALAPVCTYRALELGGRICLITSVDEALPGTVDSPGRVPAEVLERLKEVTTLPHGATVHRVVDALPVTSSGKPDYHRLRELIS